MDERTDRRGPKGGAPNPRRWLPGLAVAVMVACADPPEVGDTPDATVVASDAAGPAPSDAALADAGSIDVGLSDAAPLDAGTSDATPMDASLPLPQPYEIYFSKRTGSVLATASDAWSAVDTDALRVRSDGGRWLLILSVLDTWNAEVGGETWFSIHVGGVPVEQAVYSTAIVDQKIPVNVMGVVDLPAGEHVISAHFRSSPSGMTSTIGAEGTTTLIAMRLPDDVAAVSRGGTPATVSGQIAPIDFGGPLTITSTGADYLFVLHAPDVQNDGLLPNGSSWFYMKLNGGPLTSGGTWQAVANQKLPTTLVAVASLPPGAHALEADWATGAGTTSTLGSSTNTWLMAIRLPDGAAFRSRRGSILGTATPNWESLSQLGPLSLDSRGENHLVVLAAPDSWSSATAAGPWFSLDVDAASVAMGGYLAGLGEQRVATTIFTALSLSRGLHSLTARWHHRGAAGASYLGADHDTWLVGLR